MRYAKTHAECTDADYFGPLLPGIAALQERPALPDERPDLADEHPLATKPQPLAHQPREGAFHVIAEIPSPKNLTAALNHLKGACGVNALDEAVLIEAVDDGVQRLLLTVRDVHSHEVRLSLGDVVISEPGRCLAVANDAFTASKYNDLAAVRLSDEAGQLLVHGESDTEIPLYADKFDAFGAGEALPAVVGSVYANELYAALEQAQVLVKEDTDSITFRSDGDRVFVYCRNNANTIMGRGLIEYVGGSADITVSYPVKVFKHLPKGWEGLVSLHLNEDTQEMVFANGPEYLRLRQPYPDSQATSIDEHLNVDDCPFVTMDRDQLLRAIDRAIALDILDNVILSLDGRDLLVDCQGIKKAKARIQLRDGEGEFEPLKVLPLFLAKALSAFKKEGSGITIEVIQKMQTMDNPFLAAAAPGMVVNTQSTFLKVYDPDRDSKLVVVLPCQSKVDVSA